MESQSFWGLPRGEDSVATAVFLSWTWPVSSLSLRAGEALTFLIGKPKPSLTSQATLFPAPPPSSLVLDLFHSASSLKVSCLTAASQHSLDSPGLLESSTHFPTTVVCLLLRHTPPQALCTRCSCAWRTYPPLTPFYV